MDSKTAEQVHAALVKMKNGDVFRRTYGICHNLREELGEIDGYFDAHRWVSRAARLWPELNGNLVDYPIGGSLEYFAVPREDKWNPETLAGQRRLKFLDYLIDKAKESIDEQR